jgi:hypothetical protein
MLRWPPSSSAVTTTKPNAVTQYKVTRICDGRDSPAVRADVGIYQFWLLDGWAQVVELRGSLRSTVRQAVNLAPLDTLPYCSNANMTTQPPPAVRLPCMSSDPILTGREDPPLSLLIGTRLSTSLEVRNTACADNEYGCNRWEVSGHTSSSFIGDVEQSTILVQHAMAPVDQVSTTRPYTMPPVTACHLYLYTHDNTS